MSQIIVQGTHVEITDALRAYVMKRMNVLSRHMKENDTDTIAVELSQITGRHKHGNMYQADIRMTVKGTELYVSAQRQDLYATIDRAQEEMIRELTKHKGKHIALMRYGAQRIKNMLRR